MGATGMSDGIPASLAADFDRWKARRNDRTDEKTPASSLGEIIAQFKSACESLPESVALPYEDTDEGKRLARFRVCCPPEFFHKVNPSLLSNRRAFEAVAGWNGHFRGICATGQTGAGKTRAAWSALGRLWVKENVGFSWWPVRKLILDIGESNGDLDGLMYRHAASRVFMVDDIDKLNLQFESNGEALFAFYDYVYRKNVPCITTTNQPRTWWSKKMGEAFARRLFDDAHDTVDFSAK